jgi:hypothetical protein
MIVTSKILDQSHWNRSTSQNHNNVITLKSNIKNTSAAEPMPAAETTKSKKLTFFCSFFPDFFSLLAVFKKLLAF